MLILSNILIKKQTHIHVVPCYVVGCRTITIFRNLKQYLFDIIGNGKLDFEGFVEMMAQDSTLVVAKSEDEVKTAFQYIDQNADGFITVEELKGRFSHYLSDEEAARLIKEADKNGDGMIDFEGKVVFFRVTVVTGYI